MTGQSKPRKLILPAEEPQSQNCGFRAYRITPNARFQRQSIVQEAQREIQLSIKHSSNF